MRCSFHTSATAVVVRGTDRRDVVGACSQQGSDVGHVFLAGEHVHLASGAVMFASPVCFEDIVVQAAATKSNKNYARAAKSLCGKRIFDEKGRPLWFTGYPADAATIRDPHCAYANSRLAV